MPTPTEYSQAIQNLAVNVHDGELKRSEPVVNPMGLPLQYAGGFAVVFQIRCPRTGKQWAVKCFTKDVEHRSQRYQTISQHLRKARLPFMVGFEYQEEGILVGGNWHPIVKMEWVAGDTLNRFVESQLTNPNLLRQLLRLWIRMARRLHESKVTHADLQHGNVLLVPSEKENEGPRLRLVDYDGIYVPDLENHPSGELGHKAFQHPQRLREETYSADVDRFSHLSIYTAIRCLITGGQDLWNRFDNGDNLLFREEDLSNPRESQLFHELWAVNDPSVHVLVGRLLLALRQPLAAVPLLDDFHRDGQLLALSKQEEKLAAEVLYVTEKKLKPSTQKRPKQEQMLLPPKPERSSTASPKTQRPKPPQINPEGKQKKLRDVESRQKKPMPEEIWIPPDLGNIPEDACYKTYDNALAAAGVLAAIKEKLPVQKSAYVPSGKLPAEGVAGIMCGGVLAIPASLLVACIPFSLIVLAGAIRGAWPGCCLNVCSGLVAFVFGLVQYITIGSITGLTVANMGKTGKNRNVGLPMFVALLSAVASVFLAMLIIARFVVETEFSSWFGTDIQESLIVAFEGGYLYWIVTAIGMFFAGLMAMIGAQVIVENAKFCEPCELYMERSSLKKTSLEGALVIAAALKTKNIQLIAVTLKEKRGGHCESGLFYCPNCECGFLDVSLTFNGKYKGENGNEGASESWMIASSELSAEDVKRLKKFERKNRAR
jgi:serine/threonine protein kinase